MEIQQHDGVVVDVAGLRQGFAKLLRERERDVAGEEGGAQGFILLPSLPPTIYRTPGGGAPPLGRSDLQGGRRPSGGEGVPCPPRQGGSSPPMVPNPRRMGGGPRGGAQPTRGWFPSTFSPWGPPG